MKYQQIIMAKRVSPDLTELRQFYAPVDDASGRWRPRGDLREQQVPQAAMFGSLDEYEHGSGRDCGPLGDITPPDGWSVVARLWLPDNYVPESAEVREEGEKRAKDYLRRMLNDE